MPASRKVTADAKSIGELLRGPVAYRVPANQRDFAWKVDEQIDVLWEDLTAALEDGRDEYFLGAVVISPLEEQGTFEIVDGQQRLTALSMIFAAVRRKWGSDERAGEVFDTYLGSKDRRTRETISKLTLNETNDPTFQTVVLDGQEASSAELRVRSNRLLAAAYKQICIHLDAWCERQHSDQEDALIELEEFISKSVNLIVIQVGDESDAFIIFETLNDRGLELAVSDLVKNYLFSQAGEKLIGQFKQSWSEISQAVGSENLPAFLRHYWLSEHELVRERELYRNLREAIRGPTRPRQFVQKLKDSAEHYAALGSPDHPYWGAIPGDPQRVIRTLRLLRATQFRPLALAVMDGGADKEVMSMLRAVLAVSVRYIIAGYGANQLERAYSDAAIAVRKSGKRNAAEVVEQLKPIYIGDRDFAQKFSEYGFAKSDLARYILGELNAKMEPDKGSGATEDASLEHILPRNPSSAWKPLPPADELPWWVERIGNLTLLEKGLNRSLGSKDFQRKRDEGYKSSKLALNEVLSKAERWTIEEIESRSEALAKVALGVWRLNF